MFTIFSGCLLYTSILIREVETKNIMTKSSLPVGGYSVNPYVGCTHACKYCYASFMKRFTGHKEEWGTFPVSYTHLLNCENHNSGTMEITTQEKAFILYALGYLLLGIVAELISMFVKKKNLRG